MSWKKQLNKRRFVRFDPVKTCYKNDQPIVLYKVIKVGTTYKCVQVHNETKTPKKSVLNSRCSQRFEKGCLQIKECMAKKKGFHNTNLTHFYPSFY